MESEKRIKELEENGVHDGEKYGFYLAARIVSEAMINYALRYAELAEKLAEETENETRKNELLKIADICRETREFLGSCSVCMACSIRTSSGKLRAGYFNGEN